MDINRVYVQGAAWFAIDILIRYEIKLSNSLIGSVFFVKINR